MLKLESNATNVVQYGFALGQLVQYAFGSVQCSGVLESEIQDEVHDSKSRDSIWQFTAWQFGNSLRGNLAIRFEAIWQFTAWQFGNGFAGNLEIYLAN